MLAQVFHPSTWEAEICLDHKVSSKTTRAMQRDPVSKKKCKILFKNAEEKLYFNKSYLVWGKSGQIKSFNLAKSLAL